MKTFCSTNGIILTIIALLIASVAWLTWVEQAQRNDTTWWAVSFVDPLSQENFDITITNHSIQEKTFMYEVTTGTAPETTTLVPQQEVVLPAHAQKVLAIPGAQTDTKKITVSVRNGDDEKELYK